MTEVPEPTGAIRYPELGHVELKLSYLKQLNPCNPIGTTPETTRWFNG